MLVVPVLIFRNGSRKMSVMFVVVVVELVENFGWNICRCNVGNGVK